MDKTDVRKKIATNLKALRMISKMSKKEAAEKIGISYIYYCQLEDYRIEKNISNEVLAKIATAFDIELYLLFK